MILHSMSKMRWTLVLAAVAGALMAPVGQAWWTSLLTAYDEQRPIVSMRAVVTSSDEESITVNIDGRKLRQCDYIRMQAYARSPQGNLTDAYIRRLDRQELGDTKPLGWFNVGSWRIWPVNVGSDVLIYVQHDCNGRIVQTKIAEIVRSP